MLKITIPRITPSGNKLLRKHWRFRHSLAKLWDQEIRVFVYEFDRENPDYFSNYKVGEKKKVKIISYRKSLLEFDNFVTGCKPLVDSLRYNGLILDDNEKYVDVEYKQERDPKNQRTEIIISSL